MNSSARPGCCHLPSFHKDVSQISGAKTTAAIYAMKLVVEIIFNVHLACREKKSSCGKPVHHRHVKGCHPPPPPHTCCKHCIAASVTLR